jgi:lysophospholipase L1-like esterase
MSDLLPLTWENKTNSPELEAYFKQFGSEYYFTAEEINGLRDAMNELFATFQGATDFKGPIDLSSPAPTVPGYFIPTVSGTYTNFGGLVVDLTLGMTTVTFDGTAYKKQVVPINLSLYAKKTDIYNSSSLNLIPHSHKGLARALNNGTQATHDVCILHIQEGTPVNSIVANYDAFENAIKSTVKVGDRAQIKSSLLDLNKLTLDSTTKVNFGCYIKVPTNYTGIITITIRNQANTILSPTQEFLQLGNNWRYYRFPLGFTLGTATTISALIDINNNGSVTNDIYVSALSLIKTDNGIAPAIYNGIDVGNVQSDVNALNLNKSSLVNLLPNANKGMFFSKLGGVSTSTDKLMAFTYQSGTPTVTIEEDTFGFPVVAKLNLKVNDRVNIFSSILDLTTSILDLNSKVNIGFFLKVPNDYTSSINFYLRKSSNGTLYNGAFKFVQFGNGWRYYTFESGVSIPTASLSDLQFHISLNNNAVGTVDSILYFSNPAIVKSDFSLIPAIYSGIDNAPLQLDSNALKYTDLTELNNNPVPDSLFAKQTVGATLSGVWSMGFGGNTAFQGTHRMATVTAPYNNIALEIDVLKRSSDGYVSDNQPFVIVNIPKNLVGKTTYSFGAWMKRESLGAGIYKSYITYYSSENGVTAISSSYSTNPTIVGETIGSWVFVKYENITIPTNSKSIKFGFRIHAVADNLTNDVIVKAYITNPVINFASGTIAGYTRSSSSALDASGVLPIIYGNIVGRKWCSFGDSITAANGYQSYVINKFALTHYLRGIGGSGVSQGTSTAWVDANGLYITRPPASPPAGTEGVDYFTILSQGYEQQRVDTIPTDTGLITIMFGTNDTGLSIGAIADAVGVNTFYGKYYEMLDKIQIRVPNAEMVLMTPVFRSSENYTTINMYAIRKAVFDIGSKYGYKVIDIGGECGINKNNSTTFLTDGVHPTSSGYERMSLLIIRGLQYIFS